jgi:hypothetical protein
MNRNETRSTPTSRAYRVALTLVVATASVVEAASLGQAGDAPLGVLRVRHGSHQSADVRTDVAPQIARGAATVATVAAGGAGGALVIDATFDGTITSDPNAAAIEAAIADAIRPYESLFDDPITVSIRFRYATTYSDGTTPLPGLLAASETSTYVLAWSAFVPALTSDATTPNDVEANVSLIGVALSPKIYPSSADGRAVGLATPPVMFADGSVGPGGPYDGIVTINANAPFDFTRPPAPGAVDARRSIEHEIDEVLGLGSNIGRYSDLRPQDLFSWSAPNVRNLTATGSRYFSIDAGITNLVGFNQDPDGDYGDWLSAPCPQATPYVQNAFSCPDQVDDVTATSPEGIGLDVIGYDLVTHPSTSTTSASTTTTPTTSTTTTTTPPCPSPEVECCPAGQPGCGVCGVDCGNGACCPGNLPVCDNADGLCRACAPSQVQCCPAGQPGCGVCGTSCGDGTCCPETKPVCDNANGVCLVQGPPDSSDPECAPDQVPCTDSIAGFTDEACCAQPTKAKDCAAACSAIVADCKESCASASRPKKCRKRCQAAIVGHCRRSRPHACS